MRRTVAVGVSGGVDSAVALHLLRRNANYNVVAMHMTNWDANDEDAHAKTCAERERHDAERVCAHLDVPCHHVSFVKEYWTDVFQPYLGGLAVGGTPNPDVACNRLIKFDRFLRHARQLGADCVATGHYARVRRVPDGGVQLLRAADPDKDQSYFLSSVRQSALRDALFPIGHLLKPAVRELAHAVGLHTATKRDSVGICFVGKRPFRDFIRQYLPLQPRGPMVDVDSGRVVAEHNGLSMYTHGQRARVGGLSGRWFVVGKRLSDNTLAVCSGGDHPALLSTSLLIGQPDWVAGVPPARLATAGAMRCGVRVRHTGRISPALIELVGVSGADKAAAVCVTFDEPTKSAPLQHLAMYDGDVCLGGATIVGLGPSVHDLQRCSGEAVRSEAIGRYDEVAAEYQALQRAASGDGAPGAVPTPDWSGLSV